MDEELTDRRGLMRGIATQLAQQARAVANAHSELREQLATPGASGPLADPGKALEVRRLLPALLTEQCASDAELVELAAEFGLADRRDAVSAVARTSLRLAPSLSGGPRFSDAAFRSGASCISVALLARSTA